MAETHVVSALRAKRAEISGYIHDLEKKIGRLRASSTSMNLFGCFGLMRSRQRGLIVELVISRPVNSLGAVWIRYGKQTLLR